MFELERLVARRARGVLGTVRHCGWRGVHSSHKKNEEKESETRAMNIQYFFGFGLSVLRYLFVKGC
jgi:hypothetical protein